MSRPTNQQLVAEFRLLLTEGARTELADLVMQDGTPALEATKPWRNAMWRKFAELETRLCPTPLSYKKDQRRQTNESDSY